MKLYSIFVFHAHCIHCIQKLFHPLLSGINLLYKVDQSFYKVLYAVDLSNLFLTVQAQQSLAATVLHIIVMLVLGVCVSIHYKQSIHDIRCLVAIYFLAVIR